MKDWFDRIDAARPQVALAGLGIGVGAALFVWVGLAMGRQDYDRTSAVVMLVALGVWLLVRKPRH